MTDMTTAEVARIPECDVCKIDDHVSDVPALYDMKLILGPWAFVCEAHFRSHTNRELGTGKGQKLVLIEGNK